MTADIHDQACAASPPYAPADAAWPGHLTTQSPTGWVWWRDAVLRGAGFSADMLHLLQDADASAAADDANAAQSACDVAFEAAATHVRERIAAWRASTQAGDGADHHASDRGRTSARLWRHAQKALRRRDIDEALDAVLPSETIETLRRVAAQAAQARAAHAAAHAAAEERLRTALSGLASDPRLRAAVAWQNHAAVAVVLDALAAGADGGASKRRQREALVANYAQRYSVKNDTIGFFGPMAWVRIEGPDAAPFFRAGADLVRARSVHFEDWAIAALADRLAGDDRYLPDLVVHLQPFLRLEGTRLRLPGGSRIALDAQEALLLAACDGVRTVGEIERGLGANPFSPLADRRAVHALLRRLEREQRVHLAFRMPSCQDNPERALRAHLLCVRDEEARAQALAKLDRLLEGRDRVRAVADDGQALPAAMAALDETFSAMTGTAARRRGGAVYGGRALLYEDCLRDVDLVLGEAALAPLADALSLVLTAARWLTAQIAQRYRELIDSLFDALLADAAPAEAALVALPDLWLRLQSLLFADEAPIDDIALALRERWEDILDPFAQSGVRRRDYAVADLRAAVATAFPATDPGWNLARYQCPDVMFCAADPQALLAGRYLAVLGEVHVGGNTLMTNLFASQHPDRAALLQAARVDLGRRYVVPKLSPAASNTPIRTQMLDDPDAAVEILFSHGLVPARPETAVRSGDLDVVREEGRLRVRHRGRDWSADLLDAIGDFVFLTAINQFGVVSKRAHVPRLTIGHLVVQRESWTFVAGEIAAIVQADDATCHRGMRGFARMRGMPPRIFAKLAWEAKPFLLDFDSLISVRTFARQVRHAIESGRGDDERVSLSEMLPDLDALWLRNRDGRSFTSELRLVALHRDDVGG